MKPKPQFYVCGVIHTPEGYRAYSIDQFNQYLGECHSVPDHFVVIGERSFKSGENLVEIVNQFLAKLKEGKRSSKTVHAAFGDGDYQKRQRAYQPGDSKYSKLDRLLEQSGKPHRIPPADHGERLPFWPVFGDECGYQRNSVTKEDEREEKIRKLLRGME